MKAANGLVIVEAGQYYSYLALASDPTGQV